ncbi:MAG: hypothetical protein KA713_16500 [Chryseotalea sp. WA131a]|nr:MAG: hypothetical protein KA713_16500 [Chryseotalea sp. WA131a]
MNRLAIVEDIQQKVATIESQEILKELQEVIDELLLSNQQSTEELPLHVLNSINISIKELEEGKGIPHEEVIQEIRTRFSEAK